MIPVYKPWITDLEKSYVNEALNEGWISSGRFIEKSEELLANYLNVKYALVASSGTTALHLCLRVLDNKLQSIHDDIDNSNGVILIPNTTFVASSAVALYDKRAIELVDINYETWNIDLDLVDEICSTTRVFAVMPVHLYGNPCDMDGLLELQNKYEFNIIEDACESLGASINGIKTGTIGDVGCFSFYGNKLLSCGEGGAVVTNNENLYKRAKLLRGQAQDPNKRYWHIDVGYNYRMTNIQAAILTAQLERINEITHEKQRVNNRYIKNLDGIKMQKVLKGHINSNWLISIELPGSYLPVEEDLRNSGIETRKIFYPISSMPSYNDHYSNFPNSERLSSRGLSLPSYPQLTDSEIDFVCNKVKESISKNFKNGYGYD